jgi:hypothetical protein
LLRRQLPWALILIPRLSIWRRQPQRGMPAKKN